MEKVEVYLTPVQHKKFLNKQAFQLTANQLKASDKTIGKKFHVELVLTKPHYKKLLSNVKAGKGYRFTEEAIVGGSILGELWNGAKAVGNKIAEYVPADVIRKGAKMGLTAGATALGTMVGNPELGLLASSLIDNAVDYGERAYNMYNNNPNMREQFEQHLPQMQQYVEDRVPVARRAREVYKKYAPKARKVYQKAKRVYYNEDDDEDDEDDEEDYEPAPRRRRQAPQPKYSAPAPSDYSGYQGRGLIKKGSPEMKAKMAKLRAMRKGKGVGDEYINTGGFSYSNPEEAKKDERKIIIRRAGKTHATLPYKEGDRTGGNLAKGSQAMKDKMAKLRAMRKGGKLAVDTDGKIYNDGKDDDGMIYGFIENERRTTSRGRGDDKPVYALSGKGIKHRGRRIKGGWNPFSADDWNDVGNAISGVANSAVGTIADTATNVGNTIADGTRDVGDKIKNGATDAFNKIGDSLRDAGDNVVDFYRSATSTVSSVANEVMSDVAKNLPSEADAKAFGKQVASTLIHKGIPQATAYIIGGLCEAMLPEAGPVAGMLGSQLGQKMGDMIADKVGEETGLGFRRTRGHRVLLKGGTLHKGVPYPHYTPESLARIQMHGLAHREATPNGLHRGGSFRELGSRGGSFREL